MFLHTHLYAREYLVLFYKHVQQVVLLPLLDPIFHGALQDTHAKILCPLVDCILLCTVITSTLCRTRVLEERCLNSLHTVTTVYG